MPLKALFLVVTYNYKKKRKKNQPQGTELLFSFLSFFSDISIVHAVCIPDLLI